MPTIILNSEYSTLSSLQSTTTNYFSTKPVPKSYKPHSQVFHTKKLNLWYLILKFLKYYFLNCQEYQMKRKLNEEDFYPACVLRQTIRRGTHGGGTWGGQPVILQWQSGSKKREEYCASFDLFVFDTRLQLIGQCHSNSR